jgi:hypothetical protein
MGMLRGHVAGTKSLDSHLQMSFLDGLETEDGNSLDLSSGPQGATARGVSRKSRKGREGKFLDSALQMALSWDFIFDEEISDTLEGKAPSTDCDGGGLVAEDWTEDELVQLHQYLLEQSMIQALNPRSSKSTRLDVLDWVDQITPYLQKPAPFSFDACCQFSGYDPEELREHLHDEMKFRGIHPHA